MVKTSTDTTGKEDGLQSAERLIAKIWACLENVCDPEVPVLSVLDLGVVRTVALHYDDFEVESHLDTMDNISVHPTSLKLRRENRPPAFVEATAGKPSTVHRPPHTVISITPTYTGCPAMNMIAANIKLELLAQGFENVAVEEVLSPAWTTDWMRDSGKRKLLEYGIAPPQSKARIDKMLFSDITVPCPQCSSDNTELISEFGSTACKSLYRCLDCKEPFDYFKCH